MVMRVTKKNKSGKEKAAEEGWQFQTKKGLSGTVTSEPNPKGVREGAT